MGVGVVDDHVAQDDRSHPSCFLRVIGWSNDLMQSIGGQYTMSCYVRAKRERSSAQKLSRE